MTSAQTNETKPVLVLGATGATGKWVVQQLLDQGRSVKVVVRSKDRMVSALKEIGSSSSSSTTNLEITEAALLDLPDSDLEKQVAGCEAVVSCLGHNLNLEGLWGRKGRRLVTETLQRVVKAIEATDSSSTTKLIVMGSDGVSNPNGNDDKRTMGERVVLFLLRWLIPPHADNEEAAAFMNSLGEKTLEWSVIRPTDLIDGPPTGKYKLFDKPQGGLFGAGIATRSNVAHMMVELIVNDKKWQQYKFQMPVLHDIQPDPAKSEL